MAVDSGTYTSSTMKARQRLAEAMMKQGMDTSPIGSHWQGLSRLANALIGGMSLNRLESEEKAQNEAAGKAMADSLLGPSASAPTQSTSLGDGKRTLMPSATSSPDTRGGGDDFLEFVRKQEGWNPKAYGDYKQTSIGYGTKAMPGETEISREEGEKRLRTELSQSRQLVQAWAKEKGLTLSPKRDDALTDLTFNSGTKWMGEGLGQAAAKGDWQAAQRSFLQYINAGGKPLPGLLARRNAAVGWLADGTMPPPPEAALAAAEGLPPQDVAAAMAPAAPAAMPPMPTQVAQAPSATMTDAGPQQQMPAIMQDQRLRAMITSPHPQVRQMGIALATEAAKRQMAGRDVTFGVIGKNQFGDEQYGWIDKTGRTITPVGGSPMPQGAPGGAPGATPAPAAPAAAAPEAEAPNIPLPPPGVDPKEWRKIQTKSVAAKAADKPRRDAAATIVTDDIDRALKLADDATLPATGPLAAVTQYIPGTNSYDVRNLLTTIKSNAGFDRLQQMREASPTGGALGAVSNRENELLQSTIGNLEQSQSDAQFRRNLKRVKNVYLDIIHGKGKGPPREDISGDGGDDGWQDIGGVKIREKR
jgi:GH24 family phage-related lysozyme (muramidase)